VLAPDRALRAARPRPEIASIAVASYGALLAVDTHRPQIYDRVAKV